MNLGDGEVREAAHNNTTLSEQRIWGEFMREFCITYASDPFPLQKDHRIVNSNVAVMLAEDVDLSIPIFNNRDNKRSTSAVCIIVNCQLSDCFIGLIEFEAE